MAGPLFVPAYGVDNYVDVALEMGKRLGDEFAVPTPGNQSLIPNSN